MSILRVSNPALFDLVKVGGWVDRVCVGLGVPGAVPYLRECCTREHTQILLGVEMEEPRALLVTQLPTPFMVHPTILVGYNSGSPALGRALMREAASWARAAGHSRLRLTNGSGRSDAAYLRGLSRVGMTLVASATAFTVELGEEQECGSISHGGS